MANWYIADSARLGSGAQSTRRQVAERLLGPDVASRIARQVTIARALTRGSLTGLGRRSNDHLLTFRDAHRGERCIVIGNGPSLNKTDLRLLEGEHTFGLNRLYLLFDKLGFGTQFHVVVNRHVVEQCAADLLAVPGRLISTWPNRDLLAAREDAVFLHQIVGPIFSMDPRRGVWEGATVTYVAMQLAYFMGFREVVLIGVDHRFATKGPAHQIVTTETQDTNHFDPNYFGKGFRWQLPDLETSELAYGLARRAFEADGRRIVDCTVDGALEVFPKADLERTLRGG
jgi:hypothetical protein